MCVVLVCLEEWTCLGVRHIGTRHYADPTAGPSRPRTKDQWARYAEWRTIEVLKSNAVATTKELEARISDFGPSRLASPNPHHVTTARQRLVERGTLVVLDIDGTEFYHLAQADPELVRSTLDRKMELQSRFTNLTGVYEKCGKNAEIVTYRALLASEVHYVPFAPGAPVTHLNGMSTARSLDQAAYGQTSRYKLGIEVKNGREWVYPESWPVWKTIGAAIELDAMPILVARRIHPTCFPLFKKIGMLGHETRSQTFSPDISPDEIEILGAVQREFFFKDVAITDEPEEAQVEFFGRIVSSLGHSFSEVFDRRGELLREYAIELALWDRDVPTENRSALYRQFIEDLSRSSPS